MSETIEQNRPRIERGHGRFHDLQSASTLKVGDELSYSIEAFVESDKEMRAGLEGAGASDYMVIRYATKGAHRAGYFFAPRPSCFYCEYFSHPNLCGFEAGTPADNIDKEAEALAQDPYYADFLREEAAFERLLPGLLKVAPDRFVAILDGAVVDQDADEFALAERISSEHPERFVLIRRVSREPCEQYLDSPEGELP